MSTTFATRPNGKLSNPTKPLVLHGDNIDVQVLDALSNHANGSMCIGSSTGEIHGLSGRIAAIREQGGLSMCFWGAFGK